MDEFGYDVLKFRVKHNFTQAQMAEKVGISRPTYSLIETGKSKPTEKTKIKIKLFMEDYENELARNNEEN